MRRKFASVAHNVYLTDDERHFLIEGIPIEVIGASLPVWLSSQGVSAPVEEVFCKYVLRNEKNDKSATINIIDEGYEIYLPQIPETWVPAILSDEKWLTMSEKDLFMWYRSHEIPKSANNLKDRKDGGAEYLRFKYLGNHKGAQIMHHCEIKTMQSLIQTLV